MMPDEHADDDLERPTAHAGDDERIADEALDSFNARRLIEHPGEPPAGPSSPAADAETQAPG